jgi:hypothetical protein
MNNFTISKLGNRPDHLLITSPGSFASANRAHCFRLTLKTPLARVTHRVLSSGHPPTRKAALCGAALGRTRTCGLLFVASPAQLPLTSAERQGPPLSGFSSLAVKCNPQGPPRTLPW